MALTAAQRAKLPPSAFVHKPDPNKRSTWRYPVPTKNMARKAGISETQRQKMHATALAYSGRRSTASTKARVGATVAKRK